MLSSFDTEYTSPLCVPRLMRNTAFPTPLFFSLSRASARTFSSYPHLSFLWMIRYLYMNSCQLSLPTSVFSSLSALLANQRLSFPSQIVLSAEHRFLYVAPRSIIHSEATGDDGLDTVTPNLFSHAIKFLSRLRFSPVLLFSIFKALGRLTHFCSAKVPRLVSSKKNSYSRHGL